MLLVGCASTPEVKQASAQVGVALAELDKAQAEVRDVYVRELEETRQIAGRAIVADAVVDKVGEMSEEEINGDLIALSTAIAAERQAFRALVDEILALGPGEAEESRDVVDAFFQGRISELRRLAAGDVVDPATAAELRQAADKLEQNQQEEYYDDMVNLVELAKTQQDVRTAISDLADYVALLRIIHAQVNEWITTDVTVKGDQVADLIVKAEKTFGGAGGGSQ